MDNIKLLVAKEGAVVRTGYASVFNAQASFEVVGEEHCPVLEELINLQPDVMIYELTESVAEVAGLIASVKEACPCTKIIILSDKIHSLGELGPILPVIDGYLANPLLVNYLVKAVELVCCSGVVCLMGSVGQVMKPSSGPADRNDIAGCDLELAVGDHSKDGGYHAATMAVEGFEDLYGLTSRENEVFHLLLLGCCNREIALRLGISEPTAKTHVGNILRKLDVRSRHELALNIMTGLPRGHNI